MRSIGVSNQAGCNLSSPSRGANRSRCGSRDNICTLCVCLCVCAVWMVAEETGDTVSSGDAEATNDVDARVVEHLERMLIQTIIPTHSQLHIVPYRHQQSIE